MGGGSMALYEFECKACGKRFELSVPMHDHDRLRDKPPACPQCGKTETHQTVSVFSCKTPAA
jgi:putative FmdB family regulatory protein